MLSPSIHSVAVHSCVANAVQCEAEYRIAMFGGFAWGYAQQGIAKVLLTNDGR
jgi:hypothetical protein